MEQREIKSIDTAELGLMYGQQVDVLHQAKLNIEAIQTELNKRKEDNGEDEQDNPIAE